MTCPHQKVIPRKVVTPSCSPFNSASNDIFHNTFICSKAEIVRLRSWLLKPYSVIMCLIVLASTDVTIWRYTRTHRHTFFDPLWYVRVLPWLAVLSFSLVVVFFFPTSCCFSFFLISWCSIISVCFICYTNKTSSHLIDLLSSFGYYVWSFWGRIFSIVRLLLFSRRPFHIILII